MEDYGYPIIKVLAKYLDYGDLYKLSHVSSKLRNTILYYMKSCNKCKDKKYFCMSKRCYKCHNNICIKNSKICKISIINYPSIYDDKYDEHDGHKKILHQNIKRHICKECMNYLHNRHWFYSANCKSSGYMVKIN